ncbi:MAG: hypothetical protein ACKVZ6_11985 [Kineosporiaceae bacterium]|jgi:uncharacterized protein YxjI
MALHDPVAALQTLDRFVVRQRITPMVNRYEIRAPAAGGGHGDVLALAQQKRMALREQVTFFADESRSVPLFGFKSRTVVDVSGTTDVVDGGGQVIGVFRKDFAASLLRSTYYLEQPGHPVATGVERSPAMALVRRFLADWVPYHFDFTHPDGTVAMSVDKRFAFGRDTYEVTVPDPGLDRRLAAAMAVALDALQAR